MGVWQSEESKSMFGFSRMKKRHSLSTKLGLMHFSDIYLVSTFRVLVYYWALRNFFSKSFFFLSGSRLPSLL